MDVVHSNKLHKIYFDDQVDPAFYWKSAFDRIEETKEEKVYFADHSLYSNYIYESAQHIKDWNMLGPLRLIAVGQVLKYLDYKFIMTTVRYLNKSFLVLTQAKCHYIPEIKREALLKVSLHEVYEGKNRMPIIRHPYYTNCVELKIIYQKWEENDTKYKTKLNYDKMFMTDLFGVDKLFRTIKKLKIFVAHSHK